jgi:hypothetical protein
MTTQLVNYYKDDIVIKASDARSLQAEAKLDSLMRTLLPVDCQQHEHVLSKWKVQSGYVFFSSLFHSFKVWNCC